MQSDDIQSAVCDVSLWSADFTCWQHPFREAQIRMHPVPLRRLSAESLQHVKVKPASEIGGILWGRILNDTVFIEDAQLVPSSGSLYNASPPDIRNLEQALQRKPGDDLKPVGYFRSHIRDGLCLSPQDQELIKKHLRNPEYVFLLVRPFEMGICVGAFFFWQHGQLQTDASDLEVPFLALEHPIVEKEVRANHAKTTKLADTSEQYQPQVAPPSDLNPAVHLVSEHKISELPQSRALLSRNKKKRSWLPLIAFAWLIAIAAAAGTTTYFAFPILKMRLLDRIAPVPVYPEVGLKVARTSDGQLDLTWNRNTLERIGAQQAQLTITDGSMSKQLTIDSAQLHSGALTYFPSGSDIQFRLEITLNAGHSIAESVRVILPHADLAMAPTVHAAPVVLPKQMIMSEKTPGTHSNLDSAHPLITARTPFQAPAYIPPREVLQLPNGRQQPRAPDLHVDLSAATYAVLPSSLSNLPAPPPRLATQVPSTAGARNIIPEKSPVVKPAPIRASFTRTVTAYVPPRPLRQVMPEIKMAGAGLAAQAGKVEIQVTIDAAGHVKDARPGSHAGKISGLVLNAAIAAARQWIFQPATLHGKAVVAEHQIVFDFRQEGQ